MTSPLIPLLKGEGDRTEGDRTGCAVSTPFSEGRRAGDEGITPLHTQLTTSLNKGWQDAHTLLTMLCMFTGIRLIIMYLS